VTREEFGPVLCNLLLVACKTFKLISFNEEAYFETIIPIKMLKHL
jgi:hypothetical protein